MKSKSELDFEYYRNKHIIPVANRFIVYLGR